MRAVIHLIQENVATLVACGAGMSRSPAIVAAAIARLSNQPPEEWLNKLVEGQPHDLAANLWRDVLSATSPHVGAP